MPDHFDAYLEWLGIAPAEQPPHHYRLLGIPLFIDAATVIEHAADRQMAYLRTFQAGSHSAVSQRLLNEVAAARICLLNPQKKAAYDRELREKLALADGPDEPSTAVAPEAAWSGVIDWESPASPVRRSSPKPVPRPPRAFALWGGAAAAVVVVAVAAWSVMNRGSVPVDQTAASRAHAATDKAEREGKVRKAEADPTTLDEPGAAGTSTRIRPPPAVAPFDEQTAKRHQDLWAKYLGMPVEFTNSIGMKFVLIPPGEFQMGSTKELVDDQSRLYAGDDWYLKLLRGETPGHRMRITKPYWLGGTEVTQDQYQRVAGDNPSKFSGESRRPVEQVSWGDAIEFCLRLSELPAEKTAGRRYTLPTEAQWEHACRAGSQGPWCFRGRAGDSSSAEEEKVLAEYGWFQANAGGQPHPVQQKRANAFGLYDIHGNVWEMCLDFYEADFYGRAPAEDSAGPLQTPFRTARGGCFAHTAGCCRSAFRQCTAGSPYHDMGFRVMLPMEESGP